MNVLNVNIIRSDTPVEMAMHARSAVDIQIRKDGQTGVMTHANQTKETMHSPRMQRANHRRQ